MKKLFTLCFALMVLTATVSAQNSGGKKSLTTVLKELEKQHNTHISFSPTLTDKIYPSSVPGGSDVSAILGKLLASTQLTYKKISNGTFVVSKRPAPKPKPVAKKDPPKPEPEPEPVAVDTVVEQPEPVMPRYAVKSNLVYDLTATINLGAEIGITDNITLDVPFNWNPISEGSLHHWGVQPEVRYWLSGQRFKKQFVGVHGHFAHYNTGNFNHRGYVSQNMKEHGYKGNLFGVGVSYGYRLSFNKHWGAEAEIGLGYAYLKYDKYRIGDPVKVKSDHKNYFGPTKIAINVVYQIK